MKNKNILILISNIGLGGGVEKSGIQIGETLSNLGYNVKVLTYYDFEKEYTTFLSRDSFHKIYKLGIMRIFNLFCYFPMRLKIYLNQNKFDVVISNGEDCNLSTYLMGFLGKKQRIINVVHTNICNKDTPYNKLKFIYKRFDKIVTVSEGIKQELIKNNLVEQQKITTIYNIVDQDVIQKKLNENLLEKDKKYFKDKNIFTFVTMGRLTSAKNHKEMLDIYEEFHKQYQNTQLLIIYGGGELYDETQKYIQKLSSKDSIFLLGRRENPYAVLKHSHAFLFTSIREGLPYSLVEAYYCGMPIISYDCEYGPKEIIDLVNQYNNQQNGYLIELGDKKSFLESMKTVYDMKQKFISQNILEFGTEKIGEQWDEILSK